MIKQSLRLKEILRALQPRRIKRSDGSLGTIPGSVEETVHTGEVVLLGKPFSRTAYANNVWDMQLYNNKIYFGHGNSSNYDPEPNAGPVPIIYLDPSSGQFATQSIVYNAVTKTAIDDEQIDRYKLINDSLYIPGHDAKEGWELGNYYKINRNDSTWFKFRNIPNAIHVSDIMYYNSRLYACICARIYISDTPYYKAQVLSSIDGLTWSSVGFIDNSGIRMYSSFILDNKAYFSSTGDNKGNLALLSVDSSGTASNMLIADFFKLPADSTTPNGYRIVRPTPFLDKIVFIAAMEINDIQTAPMWLVVINSIGDNSRIILPNEVALPIDMLARDQTLYVLAYHKGSSSQYKNYVYSTTDLVHYNEVFRFTYNSFARSFEEYEGYFYFGIGCNTAPLPPEAGQVLKSKDALL
jgi:hypothetical protein